MFRQKRLARAAQIRCENTRRAFHLSLQQLRQNEAAFQQAQEDFAIERTIYEHAALMCHCWPLLGIFGGAACGLAGLGAVALLGPLTGVALPLNALTAGTAVILGLPGVILLMVLNLL